ncbi:MAG: hypothetical protein AB7R90_00180 [Reyranellaceae bacterium]
MRALPLFLAGLAALTAQMAPASSPDAWDRFRAELVQACAAKAGMPQPKVTVAPQGTASYGVALLSGEAGAGTERKTVVCVARKTPEGIVDVEVTPPAGEWIAIE